MDQLIKILMIAILAIFFIRAIEQLVFTGKKFKCKCCNKKKGYNEMYSIDLCKDCVYG